MLEKTVNRLDRWRGYGTGAYVATSGEEVLFKLVRQMPFSDSEKVVFDVGANVGDFSAAAFDALAPAVRIHAFEPAQDVYADLATRFAAYEQIVVNNCALGREPGQRFLFGPSNNTGMASLLDRNLTHVGMESSFREVVSVDRLEHYCSMHGVSEMDLLKIDVEGFELEVLAGAEQLFKNERVRACSFEFGGCNLDSRTFLRDYFEFFSDYRMTLFRITPAGTLVSLPRYSESQERFITTNYLAIRYVDNSVRPVIS